MTLEIPLLNRAATGRARAASAAAARLDAQREFALDRIAAESRDAASALVAARERSAVAGRELALARDLAERERERMRLGEGTLLVMNLRETAAAEAAVREVNARLDWHRAVAAQRFAFGLAQEERAVCAVGGEASTERTGAAATSP